MGTACIFHAYAGNYTTLLFGGPTRANRYRLTGHDWPITHRCYRQEFLLKFAGDRLGMFIVCHARQTAPNVCCRTEAQNY